MINYTLKYKNLFCRENRATELSKHIANLSVERLADEFEELINTAPRRHSSKKTYFVGHDGIPSTTGETNRREEHLAMALWGKYPAQPVSGSHLCGLNKIIQLDYQLPLKSTRYDAGIGKIDLFGVASAGRLVVTELKVMGETGGRGDTPLKALLEGLCYAAVIWANSADIRLEISQKYSSKIATLDALWLQSSEPAPVIQILGERGWWQAWADCMPAGAWPQALQLLIDALEQRLGLAIICMMLDAAVGEKSGGKNLQLIYGGDGNPPQLAAPPRFSPVLLRDGLRFGIPAGFGSLS